MELVKAFRESLFPVGIYVPCGRPSVGQLIRDSRTCNYCLCCRDLRAGIVGRHTHAVRFIGR